MHAAKFIVNHNVQRDLDSQIAQAGHEFAEKVLYVADNNLKEFISGQQYKDIIDKRVHYDSREGGNQVCNIGYEHGDAYIIEFGSPQEIADDLITRIKMRAGFKVAAEIPAEKFIYIMGTGFFTAAKREVGRKAGQIFRQGLEKVRAPVKRMK